MNLASIPLAAKLSVGAIGGLTLLGGGLALGAHLGNGSVQATNSGTTAIVASPLPSSSPGAASKNPAAQAARKAAIAAEAQVLGVTAKQLNADFKSGKTVQQLAAAKGLSQAQFQTQYQAALKTQLDQVVTSGTLTQAQEDQAIKRLTAAIPNWSRVGAAKPSPSPSATP